MTENVEPTVPEQPAAPSYGSGQTPAVPAYGAPPPPPPPYGYAPATYGYGPAFGGPAPLGKIRGTGMAIFLTFITLGIYTLVWWYCTHEEMKRHTGQGMGGGLALLLAFLVGIVMPYVTSSEVGNMYERAGQPKPVTGATGLWYFPGVFILVGPFIWFIQTNGALNAYWRAQGVR
jgi:hypothetical protein